LLLESYFEWEKRKGRPRKKRKCGGAEKERGNQNKEDHEENNETDEKEENDADEEDHDIMKRIMRIKKRMILRFLWPPKRNSKKPKKHWKKKWMKL